MDKHLDDIQMAALLAGEANAEAQRHAASCATCAAERARLATAIGDWRSNVQLGSERPAAFWERQRRAIHAQRMSPLSSQRWSPARWAYASVAAAAVLVAIVALGITLRPEQAATVIASATPTPGAMASTRPRAAASLGPPRSVRAQSSAADDALLFAVEDALTRRAPAALEPAEALIHELDRARMDGGES
jgi:hypothetical protein